MINEYSDFTSRRIHCFALGASLVAKARPKKPFIPAERYETIRRLIISTLGGKTLSAKEISGEVGISEKDVYGHLEHIHKSVEREGGHLIVTPAECQDCGFVFKKRDRLTKPGKCPVCNGESITVPLFSVSG